MAVRIKTVHILIDRREHTLGPFVAGNRRCRDNKMIHLMPQKLVKNLKINR